MDADQEYADNVFCPDCGSGRVVEQYDSGNISGYICKHCGHEWRER